MVKLSVLVCTHNRPQGLLELLRTLVPQVTARGDRELIVVNDGTHDERYEAALAEFGSAVRYESLPVPSGISTARNRTAAFATGEYLVFTDDDCVVPPHWLDWVEARFLTHPELDVVAGVTRPRDLDKANFVGRTQAAFNLLPQPHTHSSGIQSFVTACLAIRAETFRLLGGFRSLEIFAAAGEDTDLSFRLARSNARIRVDKDWWVEHVLARSVLGEYRRFYRYGYSNGTMAMSPESPVEFSYHLRRVHLGFVRAAIGHFHFNKRLTGNLPFGRLETFAYRVVDAVIRTGLDEGAKAAILTASRVGQRA